MKPSLPDGVSVLERGWLSSNNILIIGSGSAALIDSGYLTHAAQTVALVEDALSVRPLDLLLNTHLHSDHCGGNAALQRRFSRLQTEVPVGEFDAVGRWDEEALSYRATGQQCQRFNATGKLSPGEERHLGNCTWQIHAAPGHDPQSVMLFEPASSTLISADALWENGFGIVFPELTGEPSFAEVAETLDVIESLAPRQVIPGHGSVFYDLSAALDTARRRLDKLSGDPRRHAKYAFKVLVKFKLLEQQSMPLDEWEAWRDATPYLKTIHSRFFGGSDLPSLTDEILAELIHSGAARRHGEVIENQERG